MTKKGQRKKSREKKRLEKKQKKLNTGFKEKGHQMAMRRGKLLMGLIFFIVFATCLLFLILR